MPYPSEHAARVVEPSKFIDGSFRRKTIARGVILIVGKLTDGDGSMVIQAYRFDIEYFTAEQAKNWLKEHDVSYTSFEPATGKTENNSTDNEDDIKVQAELRNEYRYIIDHEYCNRSVFNDNGDEQVFVDGIGIVYNSTTEIFPGFFESIQPGAFSRSLASFKTIKSFINHDASRILSTTRSEPALEILDGNDFMEFSAPIPPTTYGEDLIVNLKRGNIKGASFAFMINDNGDRYKKLPDGSLHRTIIDAEIYEVGPVTNPAYQQTEVGLRSKEHFEKIISMIESRQPADNELQIINEFLTKRKGL